MDYELKRIDDSFDGQPRYEVWSCGELRGTVEGCNPTFEISHPTRTYVIKRWRSKRRYWRAALPGQMAGGRYAINYETRKRAAESLLRR